MKNVKLCQITFFLTHSTVFGLFDVLSGNHRENFCWGRMKRGIALNRPAKGIFDKYHGGLRA